MSLPPSALCCWECGAHVQYLAIFVPDVASFPENILLTNLSVEEVLDNTLVSIAIFPIRRVIAGLL